MNQSDFNTDELAPTAIQLGFIVNELRSWGEGADLTDKDKKKVQWFEKQFDLIKGNLLAIDSNLAK